MSITIGVLEKSANKLVDVIKEKYDNPQVFIESFRSGKGGYWSHSNVEITVIWESEYETVQCDFVYNANGYGEDYETSHYADFGQNQKWSHMKKRTLAICERAKAEFDELKALEITTE